MTKLSTPVCNFGENAHDFDLKGIDENMWSLNKCKGNKGLLVMFICNHCPYVKAIINNLVKDLSDMLNHNVKAVAIMSNDTKNYPEDSFENMKLFSKKNNFK